MPPLFDPARRPVQPLIAQFEVESRRTEDQQRDPLAPVFSDIPQHSPNRVGVLEIMLGHQLLIKALPLAVLDQANRDGLQH
jgi:hypothetical protein